MNMSTFPVVSVVIPAYNHESYVAQAIQSVLDQTYPNIDLVVVDDGSTDGTWGEIEKMLACNVNGFRAYRKENSGMTSSANFGISKTFGEFVALLASDDYYLPTKIEEQVEVFKSGDCGVALVHTSFYYDYGGGELVSASGTYKPAGRESMVSIMGMSVGIAAPSVLFRKSAYLDVGGFDEGIMYEDIPFFINLVAKGYYFGYVNKELMVKRALEGSLGQNISKTFGEYKKAVDKHINSLSATDRRKVVYGFNMAKGRLACGGGNMALGWESFAEACRSGRNIYPIALFIGLAARSAMLSVIPQGVRLWLRKMRSNVSA